MSLANHAEAAIAWILTAHAASKDGGIPAYYDLLRWRWRPSYPETTGYTIPTLLVWSDVLHWPHLRALALELAGYLLRARTPEGGVGHWSTAASVVQADPIVFDTGQVIFGWLAAWHASGDSRYLDAALQAADWLVSVQDASGAWRQNQHLETTKAIDARVAWALLEVDRVSPRPAYVDAARRNLDWVISQQQPNGWFRSAGFKPNSDPYTHTLAYTADGLWESGLLLDEQRYLRAAETVIRIMLDLQRRDGSLAATYGPDWQPTARATCLTGNCQFAVLWLRLYERVPEPALLDAARRAVEYVAATQNVDTHHRGIRGAIAGSWPLYGPYERLKYPNWAAKFFLDAIWSLRTAEAVS
jgi:uncharacterized protein YyaL (SSP411 family)